MRHWIAGRPAVARLVARSAGTFMVGALLAGCAAATEELNVIENASRAKNCNSWQSNSAVR